MKTSYTAHIKKQMKTTKEQVLDILRWEETQYADYQYRMGCQYLQSYISTDPAGIDMLVSSRIFWNWWKNQWLFRDASFVGGNIRNVSHSKALSTYLNLHDADILIQSIYPSGAILDNGYAIMISQVIKEL